MRMALRSEKPRALFTICGPQAIISYARWPTQRYAWLVLRYIINSLITTADFGALYVVFRVLLRLSEQHYVFRTVMNRKMYCLKCISNEIQCFSDRRVWNEISCCEPEYSHSVSFVMQWATESGRRWRSATVAEFCVKNMCREEADNASPMYPYSYWRHNLQQFIRTVHRLAPPPVSNGRGAARRRRDGSIWKMERLERTLYP